MLYLQLLGSGLIQVDHYQLLFMVFHGKSCLHIVYYRQMGVLALVLDRKAKYLCAEACLLEVSNLFQWIIANGLERGQATHHVNNVG